MLRFAILTSVVLCVLFVVGPCRSDGGDDDGNPPVAPAQPVGADQKVPAPAGPGGMVYVPGGMAKIGTPGGEVFRLTRGRHPDLVQAFFYETPDHDVHMDGFFIDRYEVTNGQYYAFLQVTAATEYDASGGALGTLNDVAANLLRLKPKDLKNDQLTYWKQLYTANAEALWEAFGEERANKLKVLYPDGTVDHDKTAEKFRFEPLPRKLVLKYYNRRPPLSWSGIQPPEGKWNHPIRDVSYLDAQRFAEWAGKHIPTEAEWEWAARGPYGWSFVWGSAFPEDKEKQKERGNWGANYIDERFNPTTVAVDEILGSTSWCGTLNQIGNVAEWTSSWFSAYPGYSKKGKWDNWFGDVKVIRGGHGESREMITLRATARNFIGSGPKAPPYVSNHFPWVGFRCAWYPKAGQNQLEPIIERAKRGGRVDLAMLDVDRYQGAVTETFAESGAFDENHVYVLGPSNAVVLVPIRQLLWENGKEGWISEAWKKASRFRKTKDLAKRSSESDYPVLVLGVLHTDVGLNDVFVRAPPKPGAKPAGARGRGRRKAPETVKGTAEPGTYLLALWHGRLALTSASLEFECFVSEANKRGATAVEIVKMDPAECPAPMFELDALADEAKFEFLIPLGGKKTGPEVFVRVPGTLAFDIGTLDEKGVWRQGLETDLPDWKDTELPELDRLKKLEDDAAQAAKDAADAANPENGDGDKKDGDEDEDPKADDDPKADEDDDDDDDGAEKPAPPVNPGGGGK